MAVSWAETPRQDGPRPAPRLARARGLEGHGCHCVLRGRPGLTEQFLQQLADGRHPETPALHLQPEQQRGVHLQPGLQAVSARPHPAPPTPPLHPPNPPGAAAEELARLPQSVSASGMLNRKKMKEGRSFPGSWTASNDGWSRRPGARGVVPKAVPREPPGFPHSSFKCLGVNMTERNYF